MRRGARKDAQRGNVVAAVSGIGVAATLALSAVMNNSVVLEERAIDAHLAEIRTYWGAMGQFHYALSRTVYSEACDDDDGCGGSDKGDDDDKADAVQSYLDEITAYRILTYREEASGYFIRLRNGTAQEDDTEGKHPNYSGHLMMTSDMSSTQSTLPVLRDLAPRLPRYEMRFCVGLVNANADCGPIGSNNGGNYTEHYRVSRLSRRPN